MSFELYRRGLYLRKTRTPSSRIVTLYLNDGMTTREIGDLLGVSHTSIRRRLLSEGVNLRPAIKRKIRLARTNQEPTFNKLA